MIIMHEGPKYKASVHVQSAANEKLFVIVPVPVATPASGAVPQTPPDAYLMSTSSVAAAPMTPLATVSSICAAHPGHVFSCYVPHPANPSPAATVVAGKLV